MSWHGLASFPRLVAWATKYDLHNRLPGLRLANWRSDLFWRLNFGLWNREVLQGDVGPEAGRLQMWLSTLGTLSSGPAEHAQHFKALTDTLHLGVLSCYELLQARPKHCNALRPLSKRQHHHRQADPLPLPWLQPAHQKAATAGAGPRGLCHPCRQNRPHFRTWWDTLCKKYLDERPCHECGEMKRKDAFTKAQWRQETYRVCKECTAQKREAGTPYRCTQCSLWHAAAHFASKHQNPRWSMYRNCLSCDAKKTCFVCQRSF